MSWRTTQLGNEYCDQDQLIVDLFKDELVKYVGPDLEFASTLKCSNSSGNLILILNNPMWLSDIVKKITNNLPGAEKVYIGINRYTILGNDLSTIFELSNNHGPDIIKFVTSILEFNGYTVLKSGSFDEDRGGYFNFVQPVTWIYGTTKKN